MSADELRLDLEELRRLEGLAKRPRVLSALANEIRAVDAKVVSFPFFFLFFFTLAIFFADSFRGLGGAYGFGIPDVCLCVRIAGESDRAAGTAGRRGGIATCSGGGGGTGTCCCCWGELRDVGVVQLGSGC